MQVSDYQFDKDGGPAKLFRSTLPFYRKPRPALDPERLLFTRRKVRCRCRLFFLGRCGHLQARPEHDQAVGLSRTHSSLQRGSIRLPNKSHFSHLVA